MVESTCFQHTSSHSDKYNNSVDRIISKEEEREDPRRDSSIYLRVVVFSTFLQELQDSFEYSVFYSVSTRNPATPSNSAYRINSSTRILQEILQLQGSSRAGSFQQLFPVSPSILHGRIRLPRPYSTSKLPVILPGRNSILHGSQHPRSPYSNSQASSTVLKNSTRKNRILSKGLSIVCPYNTKVSVFQSTYSCLRIIPQEN